MRQFILTSSEFHGQVTFIYTDSGNLKMFNDESIMNEPQQRFLLTHLPRTISEILEWKKRSKTAKFREVDFEVSFEQWWEKYGYKTGRLKAVEQWQKLKPIERIRAFEYIDRYKTKKKLEGTALLYPERYLKNRVWEDES